MVRTAIFEDQYHGLCLKMKGISYDLKQYHVKDYFKTEKIILQVVHNVPKRVQTFYRPKDR